MPQLQLYWLELSTNSTCILVRSWLFCIQHFPCLVSFRSHPWRQCGGLNEKHYISVHIGSNSFWNAKKVLKWVWPSTNPNKLLFNQIQTPSPSTHHKWKEIVDVVCKTTNRYSHRGQTPDEQSHWVEGCLHFPKKAGTPQNPKTPRVSEWTKRDEF